LALSQSKYGAGRVFLDELNQKHDVQDMPFIIDGAPWLNAALYRIDIKPKLTTFDEHNLIESVVQEIKHRMSHFTMTPVTRIPRWMLSIALTQKI
jgi:putative transposase